MSIGFNKRCKSKTGNFIVYAGVIILTVDIYMDNH